MPADDPRTWRPQRFGHRNARHLRDPIVEPLWEGVRVLAYRGAGGEIALLDEDGDDFAAEYPEVTKALGEAITVDRAVVDGYLTRQATRAGEGVDLVTARTPTAGEVIGQMFVGSAARARPEQPSPDPARQPMAFVAVDLLLVDDEPLLDVPLLERKRILESILTEDELIRRTPYVRLPIDTWLVSWRSLGFRKMAYKTSNGRYAPGADSDEWTTVAIPTN